MIGLAEINEAIQSERDGEAREVIVVQPDEKRRRFYFRTREAMKTDPLSEEKDEEDNSKDDE